MYFKTREIEEEDNEDDYSDSNSSSDNKGDDADQDEAVENIEIYETDRPKCKHFTRKPVNVKWAWERWHAVQV